MGRRHGPVLLPLISRGAAGPELAESVGSRGDGGGPRFWLRRGVDGFRVDASAVLIEDDLLRDDPPDPAATHETPPPQRQTRIFTDDRREAMTCLEEIRQIVDEFPDRVLAGEVQGKPIGSDTSTGRSAPGFIYRSTMCCWIVRGRPCLCKRTSTPI